MPNLTDSTVQKKKIFKEPRLPLQSKPQSTVKDPASPKKKKSVVRSVSGSKKSKGKDFQKLDDPKMGKSKTKPKNNNKRKASGDAGTSHKMFDFLPFASLKRGDYSEMDRVVDEMHALTMKRPPRNKKANSGKDDGVGDIPPYDEWASFIRNNGRRFLLYKLQQDKDIAKTRLAAESSIEFHTDLPSLLPKRADSQMQSQASTRSEVLIWNHFDLPTSFSSPNEPSTSGCSLFEDRKADDSDFHIRNVLRFGNAEGRIVDNGPFTDGPQGELVQWFETNSTRSSARYERLKEIASLVAEYPCVLRPAPSAREAKRSAKIELKREAKKRKREERRKEDAETLASLCTKDRLDILIGEKKLKRRERTPKPKKDPMNHDTSDGVPNIIPMTFSESSFGAEVSSSSTGESGLLSAYRDNEHGGPGVAGDFFDREEVKMECDDVDSCLDVGSMFSCEETLSTASCPCPIASYNQQRKRNRPRKYSPTPDSEPMESGRNNKRKPSRRPFRVSRSVPPIEMPESIMEEEDYIESEPTTEPEPQMMATRLSEDEVAALIARRNTASPMGFTPISHSAPITRPPLSISPHEMKQEDNPRIVRLDANIKVEVYSPVKAPPTSFIQVQAPPPCGRATPLLAQTTFVHREVAPTVVLMNKGASESDVWNTCGFTENSKEAKEEPEPAYIFIPDPISETGGFEKSCTSKVDEDSDVDIDVVSVDDRDVTKLPNTDEIADKLRREAGADVLREKEDDELSEISSLDDREEEEGAELKEEGAELSDTAMDNQLEDRQLADAMDLSTWSGSLSTGMLPTGCRETVRLAPDVYISTRLPPTFGPGAIILDPELMDHEYLPLSFDYLSARAASSDLSATERTH